MSLSAKLLDKIENLQKRALRYILSDYESTYEQLLNKAGRCWMSIYRLRTLCGEIYRTLNELKPSFVKNIFMVKEIYRVTTQQYKLNLNTPSYNQMMFGSKCLRIIRPKLWNKVPYHIKWNKNLKRFKELIKNKNFIYTYIIY